MTLDERFGLAGKVAVVTGGAGLYGLAITEALCETGATVVVASRSRAAYVNRCAALIGSFPLEHYPLDMTRADSVDALFAWLFARFGRLDVFVNNAITPPLGGTLAQGSMAQWAEAMQANAAPLLALCQHAAAMMIPQKIGSIINISSIWGSVAPDYQAYADADMIANPIAYGFLKGGVNMLTRSLASLLGPNNVRVNAISPGGVADETDAESYRACYRAKTPLGRWAHPDDIKGAVIYLASDASAYVTGANLVVDGGYTIC